METEKKGSEKKLRDKNKNSEWLKICVVSGILL